MNYNLSSTIEDVGTRTMCRMPSNLGWLEYKLNQKELDYVWSCIENKKNNTTSNLAGNIGSSYTLEDTGDWFFLNTICPLCEIYNKNFKNVGVIPVLDGHPYCLNTWWVNYQKQYEFNPLHDHSGVYSFVIWLKIPVEFEKQNEGYDTNTPVKSAFQFNYTNILGEICTFNYPTGKNFEGMMLFFPSKLRHQVYPFYNCDEERISVSGNVLVNEYM